MSQNSDERDDPFRFHVLEDFWRHDCLGHSGGSRRCNGVAKDIVFHTLFGQGLCEADKRKFRGLKLSVELRHMLVL